MELVGFKLQAVICATSGMAFLLFGYDQGVMGGLVALPSFIQQFGNPNPTFLGFMVASYDVGALFGAIGAFLFGDVVGRRWALVIGCIIVCIGATLQASAFSSGQFIVGRIVAGLGVGGISVTVPVYASECVKAHRRGLMVVIQISLVVLGIVLSALTNFGLLYQNSTWEGKEAQWRIPIALQMMFTVLVFALVPFCVESPRWLAVRGRYSEVANVVARLEGRGATESSPQIQSLAEEIVAIARHEAAIEASWKEVFAMGELQNFRRIFLSFAMGLMQQLTGMNCIVYYAAVVFQQVGLSARMSYIMSCVASIAMLMGSVSAALVIDRVGRRKVIMFGAWTVATFMGGLAASIGYGTTHPDSKKASGWAATAFIFLIEFFFGFGFLCVPWLYGSEVNSLRMRNKGAAMQCAANWGITILTVMVAPVGFANIGWKFYLVWMSITYATLPLLYFCYPETAGRSLEEMDYFFAKYQQWDVHRVAYEQVHRDDIATAVSEKPKDHEHGEVEVLEVA